MSQDDIRVVDVDELTCVYQDFDRARIAEVNFDEKQASRFLRKVRRGVPLKHINEPAGYILQMDPVEFLIEGNISKINQSLCVPLVEGVTTAKGFETMTYPPTKVLEVGLGEGAVPGRLMALMKSAVNWITKNNYQLGYFWRLQNRFSPKGTLERVAQVEVVPAI